MKINKSKAQLISEMPFFQACREADQVAKRVKHVGGDSIWKFHDGSVLTSYTGK